MVATSHKRGNKRKTSVRSPPDTRLLLKKEQLLKEKEQRLLALAQDLDAKEAALDAKENELQRTHDAISQTERKTRAVSSSAARAKAEEAAITKRVAELMHQKDILDAGIENRKRALEPVRKQLNNLRDHVEQGEKRSAEQLKELSTTEEALKKKRKAAAEKEQRIEELEKSIAAVQRRAAEADATTASTLKRIKELEERKGALDKDVKEKQAVRDALKKDIALNTNKFEKDGRKIADELSRIHDAEEHLEKKHKLLMTKEAVLEKEAKGLGELKSALTKRERNVLDNETTKEELLKTQETLDRKEKELNALQKDLAGRETGIKAKETELKKRETIVGQQTGLFSATSQDLDKRETAIAARERELDDKEKRLIHQDLDQLDREDRIKELQDSLAQDAERMHTALEKKKSELAQAQAGLVMEKHELKDTRAELRAIASRNDALISGDLSLLSTKEDEFAKTSTRFEKDARKLSQERKELESARRELLRTEESLSSREQKLREHEKDVLGREKTLSRRERSIAAIQERLEALQTRLRRTKDFKTNIRMLESREMELESTLKKNANVFLSRESHEMAYDTIPSRKAARDASRPKKSLAATADLIQEAKQLVETRDVTGAEDAIARLEHLQKKLKDAEEKRILGYDILELKTSLKLAMLA